MSPSKNPPQLSEGKKQAQHSTELSRLKACLETASAFFKTTVSEGEGKVWKEILSRASISEIEDAFRAWHFKQWGDTYPRMPTPGEIVDSAMQAREQARLAARCACGFRHGKGYGSEDVAWLWKKRKEGTTADVRWSIAQWEEVFGELDAKRPDKAPAWRKTPDGQQFLRD